YRVSPLFHSLAHGAAQTDYIGLVNNLAGRMVCPEKAMWRDDPDWVYEQALTLLADPARYEQCRSEIQAVVQPIARPGASRRAAEAVLELLGGA
ncbi:MAG: lipid-A-disaccharide synthase, partial [Candidatus Brocadiia bacterium]|nr:lipid-A-disaccharide synthase [Candidatus Brocadiia bacterium]